MNPWILTFLVAFSSNAWAVGPPQDAKKAPSTAQKTAVNKPGPSTADKVGKAIKNGWEKFKHDVQQGAKKPACTDAQRTLNQCE